MQATPTQAVDRAQVATLREKLSKGCRMLAADGHDDLVWGHLSVRDPAGRGFWLKANALGLNEITPEDMILLGFNGEVLEGDGGRHVEWHIHAGIMTSRPEIGAVAHTHPDHAVALAAAGETLRPLSHGATAFVPPEVPRFERTGDLIRTEELGREVAEAISDAPALFLVNHGIVTVGPDIETATVRAVILERACRTQLLVRGFGGKPTWSDDEEARSKRDNIFPEEHFHQVWRHLERRLEGHR